MTARAQALRLLSLPDEEVISRLTAVLQLTRPLVLFDIETTGPMPDLDRLFEFGAVKLSPVGRRVDAQAFFFRCNPTIPMPPEATLIHGVRDADLAQLPPFSHFAQDLLDYVRHADLCAFNGPRFDVKLTARELRLAGCKEPFPAPDIHVVDPSVIFAKHVPRNLRAAAGFYLGPERAAAYERVAHGAAQDLLITLEVFAAQLERDDTPRDLAELAGWSKHNDRVDAEGKFIWRGDEAVCNFGQHRGETLRQIAEEDEKGKKGKGFLDWILRKDFPDDVKHIASEAKEGRFPVRGRQPGEDDDAA